MQTQQTSRKAALGRLAASSRETLDTTPLELPEGHMRPPTLKEELQKFIRQTVSAHYAEQGAGDFDEEDDFEEDDPDKDILTPYQAVVMLESESMETLDGEQQDTPQAEEAPQEDESAGGPESTEQPEEAPQE